MALSKPLENFNNEEKMKNLKSALENYVYPRSDDERVALKDIIDKVSERLANITDTDLQKRSADQLALLIVYWEGDEYYPDRLKTLQNIAYEDSDEYIRDQSIINKNLHPPDHYLSRILDLEDELVGGLNKSRKKRRKKKSLESRKKRRKEKKSLKLRRRRRKRNKKKTKKRE